jgi:hypothetical protein
MDFTKTLPPADVAGPHTVGYREVFSDSENESIPRFLKMASVAWHVRYNSSVVVPKVILPTT